MKYVDDVRVFEGDYVYFDHWAAANGYSSRDSYRMLIAEEEMTEEELEELEEEFFSWCDDNGLVGQTE